MCGACLADPPVFDAARAAFVYDEESKSLILRLKHADQLHLAPALGGMIARAGAPFWESADMIAPVPLHRWRLLKRRYNQSAILAQEVGKRLNRPVIVDLLTRVRSTESQGQKNRADRIANMKDAFAINKQYDVTGKTIVLVDDVMTSGATLNACAEVLKKEGTSKVYAATLARVRNAD